MRRYEGELMIVLRWFGHRMEEYLLVKRIVGFDVRDVRLRERP